jgi:GNAT superfamily N-acetyltransferase
MQPGGRSRTVGGVEPDPSTAAAWDVDVVLASGLTARVRQIEPDDAAALAAFHDGLSAESRHKRYFTPMPHLSDAMLQRFVNVDHVDREALVVIAGGDIVGLGQYERLRTQPTDAEVAFSVADQLQGQGIGSLLLEHLASLARVHGIERFVAETLAANDDMLHVFARAGFEVHRRFNDGVYEIDFAIAPTTESERLRAEREHRATVASIGRLLRPASIAVDDEGDRVRASLAERFRGRLVPAGVVEPGTDLVVLDLPAADIVESGWEWAEAAAGAFMVMSGGSSDTASGGRLIVRRVVRTARRHGMRVLGPDAYGLVNTDPAVGLAILAAPHEVLPGRVGVFADTAVSAAALLDGLAARRIGISTFVGAGDKADISANDLLEFWETDPATDVILLAFGSFGNPQRFASLARRVSQRKPIVIVTPPTPLVDALCRRTGVLRADSLDDLADLARLLAYQQRWAAAAPPIVDAGDVDTVAVRHLAADALAGDHAGRELEPLEIATLLDAAELGVVQPLEEWAPVVVVRGGRDPLFGPFVEVVTEPDAAPRVALAPLTSSDLHALSYGHPWLADTLVRVGGAVDAAAELADVELTVTEHSADAARLTAARAAVRAPTGLIHRVRHLN